MDRAHKSPHFHKSHTMLSANKVQLRALLRVTQHSNPNLKPNNLLLAHSHLRLEIIPRIIHRVSSNGSHITTTMRNNTVLKASKTARLRNSEPSVAMDLRPMLLVNFPKVAHSKLLLDMLQQAKVKTVVTTPPTPLPRTSNRQVRVVNLHNLVILNKPKQEVTHTVTLITPALTMLRI